MRAKESLLIAEQQKLQEAAQEVKASAEPLMSIEVDTPEPFIGVSQIKYLTSKEICGLASELFKHSYDDFYGTKIELDQTGAAFLSIFFSHLKFEENAVTAFSPKADSASPNDMLRRLTNQRLNATEGRASYKPTRYGKDGIAKFVSYKFRDKSGSPLWDQICIDVNNNSSTGFTPEILSQLRGIDLSILCSVIFGTKNDAGHTVEYTVKLIQSLPNGESSFEVCQIDKEELDRTIRAAGISNTNNLGIYK